MRLAVEYVYAVRRDALKAVPTIGHEHGHVSSYLVLKDRLTLFGFEG